MANPLTGDFEAVLQVSGVTLDRLLGSMHQNDGAKPGLPTLPHAAALRIGDPTPINGLRGTARVQIAVPRIELIHGSTDRFWMHIEIRARYKPDPGTKPLPEFIHGTVTAQYRLEAIDPSCFGWGARAAEYLWIRVVDDSVSFTGSAVDAGNPFVAAAANVDDADANAQANIRALLVILLKTTFEATPHHVSKRFRRGAMRSLRLGVDRSAVALPIGLKGEPTAGKIDSVTQDLLDSRDFGVAISDAYIVSRIQPQLDAIRANFRLALSFYFRENVDVGLFDVDVITINIQWLVTLTKATATWSGGMIPLLGFSAGVITIQIAGQALTSNPRFNITFDATQLVTVTFDAALERFALTAMGSPTVHVSPQIFEPFAKSKIAQEITAQVQGALTSLGDELDLSARKAELIDQLRTIDDQADAHFDEAIFSADGVVARGRVALSPRRRPVIAFSIAPEGDAFTAADSWIPAGGIARFEWSWRAFDAPATPATESLDDRFLLRRPRGRGRGKFGAVFGLTTLLPGLDTTGSVCLGIRGAQMDSQGNMTPISAGKTCRRFGFDLRAIAAAGPARLFVREWAPPTGDNSAPLEESALVEVGTATPTAGASNLLVIHVGGKWNTRVGLVLKDGLRTSRRDDAGLLVLVLFRDGALVAGGPDLRAQLTQVAADLEAPLLTNEDVHGSWSAALAIGSGHKECAWRLLSPGGGVTWMHDGDLEARDLASALDHLLLPSPAPQQRTRDIRVQRGTSLASTALHPGVSDLAHQIDRHCPPLSLDRLGDLGSLVAFVQPAASSSHAHIKELAARATQNGASAPVLIAVIDGADADQAERLKYELGVEFVALPDPTGEIAGRFGVRVWPTTLTVNRQGTVSAVDVGRGSNALGRLRRASDMNQSR